MELKEKVKRWRLILGVKDTDVLNEGEDGLDEETLAIDSALASIYDNTTDDFGQSQDSRSGGKGKSSPRIAKWLSDIRSYFPEDMVHVIQNDAINKKGLDQLLLEPEVMSNVVPDMNLVTTLMALKDKIPEKSKDQVRDLVSQVIEEIKSKLENQIKMSVSGALNKREHSPIPNANSIDWKKTVRSNLKHYSTQTQSIIPERIFYFSKARKQNNWTVILDIDQSGSMADSLVYASVLGSILASIPAVRTKVVAFDSNVVDLTEQCESDPVDMLFGLQLGGGTDINKSVDYCRQFITEPDRTVFILLSDMFEGGNEAASLRKLKEMRQAGVYVIGLLTLSDQGKPVYDEDYAKKLISYNIPCFACTPYKIPDLLSAVLNKAEIDQKYFSKKEV